MNEEELMLQKKIEKREKTDTILAYILIVILLGCILIILYLKFIKKEDVKEPNEYTPTYISLNDITTSLNISNIGVTATVSNNAIVVNYTRDNNTLNLNIPLVNNELEIKYQKENEAVIESIYKEIVKDICVYYKNPQDKCTEAARALNKDTEVQGIRYTEDTNNNYIYINIMNSIDITAIKEITTYTEETKLPLTETNYKLTLEEVEITNIKIEETEEELLFTGDLENKETDGVLKLTITLYNENDEELTTLDKIYNTDNALTADSYSLSFTLNDKLKKEDIKKYSIKITR